MPIENKQDLLLRSLIKYYKNENKLNKMLNILNKKTKISLRIIDYLCTNYAKQFDVVYYVGNKKTPFNLFLDYRAQLKAYSKLQFDPFKRHNRISMKLPSQYGEDLETTVAQLNFFKWAIENKVIEYLENPDILQNVDKFMNRDQSKSKAKAKSGTNVFTASAKKHNLRVTVTFH